MVVNVDPSYEKRLTRVMITLQLSAEEAANLWNLTGSFSGGCGSHSLKYTFTPDIFEGMKMFGVTTASPELTGNLLNAIWEAIRNETSRP